MKSLKEKKKDFYDDVKDCIWFNQNKGSYRCEAGILDSFESGKMYNCVKNGRCIPYKSVDKHNREIAEKKEEWERKTYKRLKKKFEKRVFGSDKQREE